MSGLCCHPRLRAHDAKMIFHQHRVSRKAFNNFAKRPKINALYTMRVEAPADRPPRLATLLDSGGQAVSVRTPGSTSNQ